MARLLKTELIEHQPNLYNNYNIIDSKNFGFLSLIIQKVRSGKQAVIQWYTFCHSVVKNISMMVHFIGCNHQNASWISFLYKYVAKNLSLIVFLNKSCHIRKPLTLSAAGPDSDPLNLPLSKKPWFLIQIKSKRQTIPT
jgi:hypothetical protein